MAESQREPVPRNDAGELDTALAFLGFARHCVIKKTEGLTDEQLRRRMVDSGTSLLGLVQQLTDAERYWFGHHVGGHGADDFDFSMDVPADRPVAVPVAETRHSVRWVVAHMTGETTRHAGHADILRELIDGTTGR